MINGKLIKVCGLCEVDNIREVEQLDGVDLAGFIFYPKSPRYVYERPSYLPTKVRRVGVFVNENKETIRMYADRFELEYIQLHGHESPAYCRSLGKDGLKIIKAFSIAHAVDLKHVYEYEDACELFLFDTKCKQYGGSGNQFDWNLLNAYTGYTPFLLSGGINQYSAPALNEFRHPSLAGYDLNSRFELRPGVKDIERLRQFLTLLK